MLPMERQVQIDKTEKAQNQVEKAATKALNQIEQERKGDDRDYIAEWFRWVELTIKYLKNKLN